MSNPQTTDFGIYNMKLADAIDVGGYKVVRVPGGWIWQLGPQDGVFVEFHNEFMPKEPIDENLPF